MYDRIMLGDFMAVGIICEYNPFTNGHLYHLNKVKEMYPFEEIILITNSYFCQRGDVSLINKWDKTSLALDLGIDLVVELPFVYASQSADVFAKGSIEILNELKVNKIIFGSECGDIELLKKIALIKPNIKQYLDKGYSYPKSLSLAIKNETNYELNSPNDILGVSYIREINRLNSNIKPICIKRINNYNSLELNNICSATAIRNSLKNNIDISTYLPSIVSKYIYSHFIDEYFHLIKYKILTDDVSKYQTVDEGIEYRFKKYILESNSLEDFISKVKTKRYTHNKIKRMLVHILCGFTKDEAKDLCTEYIRILGFNDKGRNYLKSIKKEVNVPIITKYEKFKNLDIEIRCTYAYTSILNIKKQNELIKREYEKVIIK